MKYYEIHYFYPEYPNLPYRAEIKGLHYFNENVAMQMFNEYCFKIKHKAKEYKWITETEFKADNITYKLIQIS
jgi:hypothetical protein